LRVEFEVEGGAENCDCLEREAIRNMRTTEERKSRNIVFAALLTLFVLYFIKFTFPQHTVASVIKQNSNPHTGGLSTPKKPSKTPPKTAGPTALEASFNATITDRVAVIIEDKPRSNLIPLILHFHTVLGPSWPIIIYTATENVGTFSVSAALSRHIRSGAISIRILPPTVMFTNADSFSRFFTRPWLWEDLAPAKHVLIFQADSMLCANAARSVEDFFEYDFVGAPVAPQMGQGMSGGLSLRKRESMLRVLEEFDWEMEKGSQKFEDRWYYDRYVPVHFPFRSSPLLSRCVSFLGTWRKADVTAFWKTHRPPNPRRHTHHRRRRPTRPSCRLRTDQHPLHRSSAHLLRRISRFPASAGRASGRKVYQGPQAELG
jgi:hypothetical protein